MSGPLPHRSWLLVPALSVILARGASARADDPPPPTPSDGVAAEAITLEQAVARALARNPTVATAVAEVHRAEGLLAEARSASLPTVTGNAAYTRLDSDRIAGGAVFLNANEFGANVMVSVPLAVPAHWAQWSHASESRDIARLSVNDVRRQVAIATARAALTVLATHHAEDALRLARDNARGHYAFAHGRLTAGVGNRLDDVRSAQELATTESQVQSAVTSTLRAREALGVLAGGETPLDVIDPPVLPSADSLATTDDALVTHRADLRVLSARISAADHVRRDTWTEYLPYLYGVLQPFYQNAPTPTMRLTGLQASLVLTVPFYDGGNREGEAVERSALARESRLALEDALRQAHSDVRAAFAAVRLADASLTAAREASALAAEALDLATTAYRAGATTNLEVIDAERQARDAAVAVAVAEDAAREARLDLLVAAGRFP